MATKRAGNARNAPKKRRDPRHPVYIVEGSRHTRSGELINEETAMQYTPFLRACAVIAQTVAVLPKRVRRAVDARRYEDIAGHRVVSLLNRRPNSEMTAYQFWVAVMLWVLRWGNAYVEIVRNVGGEIIELWPIESWRVMPRRDPVDGDLYYEVWNGDGGGNAMLSRRDVLHVAQLPLGDGIIGTGFVGLGREALAYGVATERMGQEFFGNGGAPGSIISYPTAMPKSEAQIAEMRAKFMEAHGKGRRGGVMFLFDGATYSALSVPNNQAQYQETREFQVLEVSRLTGVPPYLLSDYKNAPYSTPEHQRIQFHDSCLLPWCRAIENEIDIKLLDDAGPLYCQFDLGELMKGDIRSQGEYYRNLVMSGILEPNEVRIRLGENPSENAAADRLYAPVNLAPLESLGELSAERRAIRGGISDGGDPSTTRTPAAHLLPALVASIETIARRERRRLDTLERNGCAEQFRSWLESQSGYMHDILDPVLHSAYMACGMRGDIAALKAHEHAERMIAMRLHRSGDRIQDVIDAMRTLEEITNEA